MLESKDEQQNLEHRIAHQVERLEQADRDRPGLMAQTAFIGTLGLLMVVPVIGGAYLGRWLDKLVPGDDYSSFWTLSLIVAGVMIGAVNIYLFIRES